MPNRVPLYDSGYTLLPVAISIAGLAVVLVFIPDLRSAQFVFLFAAILYGGNLTLLSRVRIYHDAIEVFRPFFPFHRRILLKHNEIDKVVFYQRPLAPMKLELHSIGHTYYIAHALPEKKRIELMQHLQQVGIHIVEKDYALFGQ